MTAGKVKDEGALAKYINDHVAFKAADDSRRLTLPQKPEDYKLEFPKDFKAPEGIEFVPNEKDPLLPQARAFAQKHGLSQEAFGELAALHAASKIEQIKSLKAFEAAEVAKLGPTGTARKTAIDTWAKASLGDELGQAVSLLTRTEVGVRVWEKVMGMLRTQGAGSFSPAHRDGDNPQRMSDADYAKLSFSERLEYAQKFGQPTPAAQQANGH